MATQQLSRKTSAGKELIYCELRADYRTATPEEIVRQEYIHHLHTHYGYSFDQMAQERHTQHGRRSPRADIVIWQSAADKQTKAPVIVVECKSDNVTIIESDYWQGESYARAIGCELFVTHNSKQTRFFKLVPGLPGEWVDIEDIPHAADWGDAKKIAAIKAATRAFNREEFRKLLFDCHNILRDVHKMDPGRAVSATVTARLIAAGYRAIHLYTEQWRLAALKSYLKLGYIPYLYTPEMPERWRTICAQLGWPFTPEAWRS